MQVIHPEVWFVWYSRILYTVRLIYRIPYIYGKKRPDSRDSWTFSRLLSFARSTFMLTWTYHPSLHRLSFNLMQKFISNHIQSRWKIDAKSSPNFQFSTALYGLRAAAKIAKQGHLSIEWEKGPEFVNLLETAYLRFEHIYAGLNTSPKSTLSQLLADAIIFFRALVAEEKDQC